MSLPVRQPPSRSHLLASHHKQSPSVPSTNKKTRTPQKQTTKAFMTPTKTSAMAQSMPDSSPLSSVPSTPQETATPPSSSPPTQLSPRTPTKTASPFSEISATGTSTGTTVKPIEPQAPTPTTCNMVKKRAPNLALKRGREEDGEEGSLPPKKSASSSNTKAKTKPAPTESVAEKPAPKKPTAKKAAPPPPPPSNRPSRNRKAPERFEDFGEANPSKVTPVRKGPSKVFDPVFITTNSTSRLGKADVYHMLLESAAWTSLSGEQQKTLLSMLPQCASNTALIDKIKGGETENTRPHAFTINNDCFRTDVAKFKEDLKNGHLAKTWQSAAEQAVIERAAGEFDAWKAEEAELWWGQKNRTA